MRQKENDRVWSCDRKVQARGFLTPPPTWTPPHTRAQRRLFLPPPFSERKMESPAGSCKHDLFHVIHKVPAGDSPYVKAKHVQLIEKDPSRAVPMFWAAINAGDRIDSALKDMAVVLKQLNRSEEAIEAIKSFRHRCPQESQESIDNVLVELYKRSGRVEEEIEMLQRKLKNIEEGMVFGGRRTKVARSQGKKIQITVEQEKARILGNLAWAYLQQHNYGLAEQHYRRALSLEPDRNKQCNLAVCLMHMNKLPEARALLQAVRASCVNQPMEESYAKSFERAYQMLTEFESHQSSDEPPSASSSLQTQPIGDHHGWTEIPYFAAATPPPQSFGILMNSGRHRPGSSQKKNCYASTTPVLFSQPRRCLFGGKWGAEEFQPMRSCSSTNRGEHQELSAGGIEATQLKMEASMVTPQLKSQPRWGTVSSSPSPAEGDWRKPWRQAAATAAGTTPGNNDSNNIVVKFPVGDVIVIDRKTNHNVVSETEASSVDVKPESKHKSWADMVEEDEAEAALGKLPVAWNGDEETGSLDENWDANVANDDKCCYPKNEQQCVQAGGGGISRTTAASRRLCFDGAGKNMINTATKRRNRLQVFKDITPSPDSPRASSVAM
ncbi:unnamed protein product [Linum tenue]|uniref:Uncharacterized protein n=2 Tax=Linum tenue TaxID=586396 RepID=A0AAV0QK38_9ROSI|nr:unnamed protein product [Linum tenue]